MSTPPQPDDPGTNWNVDYADVEPIRIRDPVAEALAVLQPGEPFVIRYEDVVTAAGHSCPTAAGAYRIAQLGLDALYPDELPVRGDVAVRAGGPPDDPAYGVTARLVSYVTGAAGEDGFGGLAGGHGGRRNLLTYGEIDSNGVAFDLTRTDTGTSVRVTYRTAELPDAGPAVGLLQKLIDGSATPDERESFAEAWHSRVHSVLADNDLFDVDRLDR